MLQASFIVSFRHWTFATLLQADCTTSHEPRLGVESSPVPDVPNDLGPLRAAALGQEGSSERDEHGVAVGGRRVEDGELFRSEDLGEAVVPDWDQDDDDYGETDPGYDTQWE